MSQPDTVTAQLDLGFIAERNSSPPARISRSAAHLPITTPKGFAAELTEFNAFGQNSRLHTIAIEAAGTTHQVPVFVNEFWTAQQRQASSLHEISYRACFKPQLPRFFVERLTRPGDVVYDPFMGRGTTPVEAALLGRVPFANDINPLSIIMTAPRLRPPSLEDIAARLSGIDLKADAETREDLLAFYHPDVLRAISALRLYFKVRREQGVFDSIDAWIEMICLNRLTGHSRGFFSVYTLPPNQAVSVKSQLKINEKRNQTPPQRDVASIILKKSKQLLGDCTSSVRDTLRSVATQARLVTSPAADTPGIPSDSVALVVTSPPFLNVVQYATDNWLRCWFAGIDPQSVAITTPSKIAPWSDAMAAVFRELHRVLKPRGWIAFEVGEVHGGETKLEETVVPCGVQAGLDPVLIMINDQEFTKTANCWGIDNMSKGTNTNRIVVFQKKT